MSTAAARLVPIGWKGLDAVTLWEAGVTEEHGLVHIPYRLPGGALHNTKLVTRHGRSWWATSGLPLLPFGLEQVPDRAEREHRLVFIAEGESDALCLREHFAAWRGRRVDVLGLPGAGTWRSEWARFITGYRGVYLFPDADRAGERMADAVTQDVRWAVVVWLAPGDDVRGVVQGRGADALAAQIMAAESVSLVLAALRFNDTVEEARRWLREVTW